MTPGKQNEYKQLTEAYKQVIDEDSDAESKKLRAQGIPVTRKDPETGKWRYKPQNPEEVKAARRHQQEYDMLGMTGLGPLDKEPDPDFKKEMEEGNWTPAHKPKRLAANLVKVEAGASAQEMNAVRQVVDALRANKISLKEVDQSAGSIVVSTGGERSVILKVMGFEGDHDVPVSMRPDKRVDSDDEALMSGRRQPNPASPRERALAARRGEAAQRNRPPSHSSFDEPSFGRDYD